MQHTGGDANGGIERHYRGSPPSLADPRHWLHTEGDANGRIERHYRGSPPSLADSRHWFEFADKSNDGFITQEEMIIAFSAHLRLSSQSQRTFIRIKIQEMWEKIEHLYNFRLSKKDFIEKGVTDLLQELEEEWIVRVPNGTIPKQMNRRSSIGQPPTLSKPQDWFEHYDTSHKNIITQEEIIFGLFETLKPNDESERVAIRLNIKNIWHIYDTDYAGSIDKWEFLEKGGLAESLCFIVKEWQTSHDDCAKKQPINVYRRQTRRLSYTPPPTFADDPEAWFQHFDINHTGALSQKELIYALFASFNAVTTEEQAVIRARVVSKWDANDYNDVISKVEFLCGMAESLMDMPQSDLCNTSVGCLRDVSQVTEVVRVTVFIPNGMEQNDLIKVASPKTQEFVVVMIPKKESWGGGNGKPHSFKLKFYY